MPSEPLIVSAFGVVCQRDVPYLGIRFSDASQYNGMPATIQAIATNGQVVATIVTPYQANTVYSFLYPGATVDPVTGEGTDWPGWRLNEFGFWIEDPSDAFLRDGLRITVDVNPHAEGEVEYPPATSACASPENTPPTPEPRLPATE